MSSLEQYLRNGVEFGGVADYALRAQVASDGRVVFYIHPNGVDGDTADFEVMGNVLSHNRDIVEDAATAV